MEDRLRLLSMVLFLNGVCAGRDLTGTEKHIIKKRYSQSSATATSAIADRLIMGGWHNGETVLYSQP
jgi:hypothetical protein